MNKKKQFSRGQSLLETVFAVGILLFVAAAILGFTISNIRGQKESETYTIATGLAQEALEAMRAIRDSNWLANRAWDSGLVPESQAGIVVYLSDGWEIDWVYSDDNLYLSLPSGRYEHNNTFLPTQFSRYVTIRSVCRQITGSESIISGNCGSGEQKIGLEASAYVEWTDDSGSSQVVLQEIFYDWK